MLDSNMNRPVTFWYTKDQPIFENTEEYADTKIDVTRIPAGSDTPPCLKISHNTFETMEKANWEFLRLSLPVICNSTFIEYVHVLFQVYSWFSKSGSAGLRLNQDETQLLLFKSPIWFCLLKRADRLSLHFLLDLCF